MSTKLNKYIELEAARANVSYEEAKAKMDEVKERYGISYAKFYANEMFHMDETRIKRVLNEEKEYYDELFGNFTKESGLSREEIIALREKYYKLTNYRFAYVEMLQFRVWELTEEEGIALALKYKAYKDIIEIAQAKVSIAFLKGEDVEQSCEQILTRVKELIPYILSDTRKEMALEELTAGNIQVDVNDSQKFNALLYDMEYMRRVFQYYYTDYIAYGMKDKSVKERLEFLSIPEKKRYQLRINDTNMSEILDNKWFAYHQFQSAFKREVIRVSAQGENKDEFKQYCDKHARFVFKPVGESLGDGVKLVDVPTQYDLDTFYNEVLGDYEEGILEELIVQDEAIGCFNPDSVNTIRIITMLNDNNEIIHLWPFLRMGRKGHFVDNASAGGMFAIIDKDTGEIISNGIDYMRNQYEAHPDTGVIFKGKKMPKWDELKNICGEMAKSIPEVRYIGWDMTYTANGEWVIVEANVSPSCRAYQSATNHGIRREFLDMLGVSNDEIKNLNAVIARKKRLEREKRLSRRIIKKLKNMFK